MKQLFKVASLNLWFGRSQKLLCKINGEKNREKEKKKPTYTLHQILSNAYTFTDTNWPRG